MYFAQAHFLSQEPDQIHLDAMDDNVKSVSELAKNLGINHVELVPHVYNKNRSVQSDKRKKNQIRLI